ncbi:hypothetical protein TMO_c0519 (plasmid) [Tistrella mobilis KA081020-065]|uniref:Uncharacterized protein n=1 Tax=Tistrella mobilis (strain KA081020-065) TaxID=1110502 RepID=I3TWJ1_TISMK|nr:hypothetical protein TMO_c0519 [Tistrella mobilis KA081020-065]
MFYPDRAESPPMIFLQRDCLAARAPRRAADDHAIHSCGGMSITMVS